MKLDYINITNYRCFERCELEFAPGFNIFIGKNGAGKTTAVKAIVQLLSFMFSNNRDMGVSYLSAGLSTLNVRSFDIKDYRRLPEINGVADFARLDGVATMSNDHKRLNWSLYKRSTSRASLYPSYYKEAFGRIATRYNQGDELPVLAYFSDSFPHHNTRNTRQVAMMASPDTYQRNYGYYQWDDEDACMSMWETRLCNVLVECVQARRVGEDMVEEPMSRYGERIEPMMAEEKAIEELMCRFSSELCKEFEIKYFIPSRYDDEPALAMRFVDGSIRYLQDLPAGYRRLFSIALDIAYRSWILNRNVNSHGIAVIDEIDLHLHPELEQRVVEVFSRTFENMQFIVTTHSPLVISNVPNQNKRNYIITFDSWHSPHYVTDIYGLDYDSSLTNVMGVSLRSQTLESLVDSYVMLMDAGLKENAEEIKRAILDEGVALKRFETLVAKARH